MKNEDYILANLHTRQPITSPRARARETGNYVLTIIDTAKTPPAEIRLRGLLKVALRRFGFRCTDIRFNNDLNTMDVPSYDTEVLDPAAPITRARQRSNDNRNRKDGNACACRLPTADKSPKQLEQSCCVRA